MPFPRLNPYTPNSTTSTSGSATTTTTTNNTENNVKIKNTKKSKQTTDRPLPRGAFPQGNFDIDYTTFEVEIPNYVFGKAIELAGAGGLIAISLGRRCVYIIFYSISYLIQYIVF